jgi:ribonuclease P protein component
MHRRYRLVQRQEFQQVRRLGRSWSHPLLVLLVAENGLSYSRFGFLVSRRLGGAVVRNRVKRWLREAARARLAHVASGWDMVLIAREPAAGVGFWRIGEALDSLLGRAALLVEQPDRPDVAQ